VVVSDNRGVDVPPPTRYARRGSVSIAYQLFGRGPPTVAWVLDWPSHLDLIWIDADLADFLRRMASFSRVVLMDRSGSGLSDPVDHVPTLEEQANDLRRRVACNRPSAAPLPLSR
jgi:pimeloyl-ACP methyl ester carboxylesterase